MRPSWVDFFSSLLPSESSDFPSNWAKKLFLMHTLPNNQKCWLQLGLKANIFEGDGADRAGVIGLIQQGFARVGLEADQPDRDPVQIRGS